jgi:hypothetical protein
MVPDIGPCRAVREDDSQVIRTFLSGPVLNVLRKSGFRAVVVALVESPA